MNFLSQKTFLLSLSRKFLKKVSKVRSSTPVLSYVTPSSSHFSHTLEAVIDLRKKYVFILNPLNIFNFEVSNSIPGNIILNIFIIVLNIYLPKYKINIMSNYSDNESEYSDSATTVSFYPMELFDEKTSQYITVTRSSHYFDFEEDSDNDTVVSLYEFNEEDERNNTHISVVSFVIILLALILPYLY